MTTLSVKRFGLAMGVTFALIRLGCDLIRVALPRDAAIRFFNILTHGVDWTPISRWSIPFWESALGLVEILVFGWIAGALVALIYNLSAGAAVSTQAVSETIAAAR